MEELGLLVLYIVVYSMGNRVFLLVFEGWMYIFGIMFIYQVVLVVLDVDSSCMK